MSVNEALKKACDEEALVRLEIAGGFLYGELYPDWKQTGKWHVHGTDCAMPFFEKDISLQEGNNGEMVILVGVRPCLCGSGKPSPGDAEGCCENTPYCG
jgi:hypothetical protein